jgi:hypothetical protein
VIDWPRVALQLLRELLAGLASLLVGFLFGPDPS